MFFADPVAAFENINHALRPGGRLAMVSWQGLECNEWLQAIRAALAVGRELPAPLVGAPGPFGLADRDAVTAVLTAAGFERVGLEPVDEAFVAGADAEAAFEFIRRIGAARGLLAGLVDQDRRRALDALRATMATHDTGQGVQFGSAAWLISARRRA